MAYDTKIIDSAHDIYLTVNDKGQRAFSYDKILQELHKIYTKKKIGKLSRETIVYWSKINNWEADLQAVKSLGKQKAITETTDKEKLLTDAKSDDIAERRIKAKEIKDKADQLLLMTLNKMIESGENELDLRVLQQISAQREDVIQNLDGIQQSNPEKTEINTNIKNRIKELLRKREND
jgi:hypothetical protein